MNTTKENSLGVTSISSTLAGRMSLEELRSKPHTHTPDPSHTLPQCEGLFGDSNEISFILNEIPDLSELSRKLEVILSQHHSFYSSLSYSYSHEKYPWTKELVSIVRTGEKDNVNHDKQKIDKLISTEEILVQSLIGLEKAAKKILSNQNIQHLLAEKIQQHPEFIDCLKAPKKIHLFPFSDNYQDNIQVHRLEIDKQEYLIPYHYFAWCRIKDCEMCLLRRDKEISFERMYLNKQPDQVLSKIYDIYYERIQERTQICGEVEVLRSLQIPQEMGRSKARISKLRSLIAIHIVCVRCNKTISKLRRYDSLNEIPLCATCPLPDYWCRKCQSIERHEGCGIWCHKAQGNLGMKNKIKVDYFPGYYDDLGFLSSTFWNDGRELTDKYKSDPYPVWTSHGQGRYFRNVNNFVSIRNIKSTSDYIKSEHLDPTLVPDLVSIMGEIDNSQRVAGTPVEGTIDPNDYSSNTYNGKEITLKINSPRTTKSYRRVLFRLRKTFGIMSPSVITYRRLDLNEGNEVFFSDLEPDHHRTSLLILEGHRAVQHIEKCGNQATYQLNEDHLETFKCNQVQRRINASSRYIEVLGWSTLPDCYDPVDEEFYDANEQFENDDDPRFCDTLTCNTIEPCAVTYVDMNDYYSRQEYLESSRNQNTTNCWEPVVTSFS